MIVYLIAMIVILLVVAGIVGVVMVGIEGRRLERYPRLAQFLTRAAQYLNGEVEPVEQPAARPRVHERV